MVKGQIYEVTETKFQNL